jgi:hypothetical protein
MRKLLAMALVMALLVGVAVPAAYAGTATNVALGLASFAVFNQVAGGFLHPRPVYAHPAPVVIERPVPVYYRQVVVQPAPPPVYQPTYQPMYQNAVQYPHGRYELRGDGVYTLYQWVWIPNVAVVPPAPPPPPLQ